MSEDGTLKASNVDLSGKITATSGSIGGFGLTSNSFTAQINYTFPTITDSDMNKIRQYLLGTGSLTPDEKTKYDFNGDGKIDSWDLQVANQLKAGVIPYNFVGNFKLNTNDPKETITLTSNSGIFDTKIGLIHGVSSKIGNFTNLTCSNLNCSSISMLSNISNMSIVTGSKNYLEVRDSSNAWGIDMWASDKRLKENIKESVYNALEKILAIEHKEFDYKNGGHVKIGYIADELEIIDPDFIFEVGEEKMKQPQISTIIPVITKAIQEQEQEILKLREELLILKKDV